MIVILVMILTFSCSCVVKSPITGLNYDIDVYKYGIKAEGDFIGLRIGTREKPILGNNSNVTDNKSRHNRKGNGRK